MQDEPRSEGMDKAERNTKISSIIKKIDYLFQSSEKNLKLSNEIRDRLLGHEAQKNEECEEKGPIEKGQFSHIIDSLQRLLNIINASNANLASVNKEL